MILVDTNILIHSNLSSSQHYAPVTARLLHFAEQEEELVICPQVLYEFYVVATRPQNKNGLGITNKAALTEMDKLMGVYTFVEDPSNLFNTWLRLMNQYDCHGKIAHDGRLVAFMQAHAINRLYTLNADDFTRYADIITILK